jgi:hypothetical protein
MIAVESRGYIGMLMNVFTMIRVVLWKETDMLLWVSGGDGKTVGRMHVLKCEDSH